MKSSSRQFLKLSELKLLFASIAFILIIGKPIESNSDRSNKTIATANRIRNAQESDLSKFTEMVGECEALDLGQGMPDFPPPNFLVDALHNATDLADPSKWKNHQYTRSGGHPRLVKALREYYNEFRGFKELQDANTQIMTSVGGTEATSATILAYVNPGDEVILIDPAYGSYAPLINFAQGKPVYVSLRYRPNGTKNSSSVMRSEDFKIDMKEFEGKISSKTKMLILNTPQNPVGKIFSRSELEAIAELCIEHNILVLSDEVYEQMYFSEPHISIATLPGMWDRTVTIGSVGKTLSATGWKIGWALGPSELIENLNLVHQYTVSLIATPLQEATAVAFEHEIDALRSNRTSYWEQVLRTDLVRMRDRMAEILIKGNFKPIIPQGGYFMLADFSEVAKQYPEYMDEDSVEGGDDFKFAYWLACSKKILGRPGGAFYTEKTNPENLLRFVYIKQDSTLDELEALIENL